MQKNTQKNNFKPFRCLLLGRSGVGKTYNGLKWLLGLIKEGVFPVKRVVLISLTWKSDPSQKELVDYCSSKYKKFKDNNCFENVDTQFLSKLFETQKNIKEKNPDILENWLLIFDDQISNNLIKRQDKDPTLKNLFCCGRHYNLNQCWMLQRLKATIDPSCRDQFSIIAIFKQGNKKALREMLQDYDESPNPDHKTSLEELYQAYLESVEENDAHGCFIIHVLQSYGKGRLQKGFNGPFFDQQ